MAHAQLSPLVTAMLRALSERSHLSGQAVMELAVADMYVREIGEPVGLPDPSSWEADEAPDEAEGEDDASSDEEPVQAAPTSSSVTDPEAVRARVLALAEAQQEPFRSVDLSQLLHREGVQITPRQIGHLLQGEGWPVADGLVAGVRRWLPLDGR